MHKIYSFLLIATLITTTNIAPATTLAPQLPPAPKLTLILVIDQFAYHYIPKLKPFLTGGIGKLLKHGVVFENALYPHGVPSTAPGHTALNTGCYPSQHGMIGNHWFNKTGKKITCEEDNSAGAQLFNRDGSLSTSRKGRSAHHMCVDGLCDQFMLNALETGTADRAITLSMKSRAAICMSGKAALPIWFEPHDGYFTTSKAFSNELPRWVQEFNNRHCSATLKDIHWTSYYPLSHAAYQFAYTTDYTHTEFGGSLIEGNKQQFPPNLSAHEYVKDKGSYELFMKTPASSALLEKLAEETINQHCASTPDGRLLLWISFSNLDKIGHAYGPHSLECIDTIYHFDHQIDKLLTHVYKKYDPRDVAVVLTADHGSMPIPEVLKRAHFPAKRIDSRILLKQLNEAIDTKWGIENLVLSFKAPQLYLHEELFASLDHHTQENIIEYIKNNLNETHGIARAWTYDELYTLPVREKSATALLKYQLFPRRSGRITFLVEPYTICSAYDTGTAHTTPYRYNRHVPLIVYRARELSHRSVRSNVSMLQVAPTLARMLHISTPSACTEYVLPGLSPRSSAKKESKTPQLTDVPA